MHETRAMVWMCCALMPAHRVRTALMLGCSDAVDLSATAWLDQVAAKLHVMLL